MTPLNSLWLFINYESIDSHLSFKGLNTAGSVEIGYGISEDYCGKGYATEAVNAVVDWAMGQQGITRIDAETDSDNTASQNYKNFPKHNFLMRSGKLLTYHLSQYTIILCKKFPKTLVA